MNDQLIKKLSKKLALENLKVIFGLCFLSFIFLYFTLQAIAKGKGVFLLAVFLPSVILFIFFIGITICFFRFKNIVTSLFYLEKGDHELRLNCSNAENQMESIRLVVSKYIFEEFSDSSKRYFIFGKRVNLRDWGEVVLVKIEKRDDLICYLQIFSRTILGNLLSDNKRNVANIKEIVDAISDTSRTN